jgi:hypothetical protein
MTDIDVYKAREEHLNETVRMWYKAYSDVQERLERPLRETILAVLRAYRRSPRRGRRIHRPQSDPDGRPGCPHREPGQGLSGKAMMTKLDPEYAVESYVEAEAKDLRDAVVLLYDALGNDAYVLEVTAAEEEARVVTTAPGRLRRH